jgi:hypothetical protein
MAKVNVNEMNGNEILDMLGQLLSRARTIEANAHDEYIKACNIANNVRAEEETNNRKRYYKTDSTIADNIALQVANLLTNLGFIQTGNNDYSIKTCDGDAYHPETCVHIHITKNHAPTVYDSNSERNVHCQTVNGANRLYEAFANRANTRLAIGSTTGNRTESLISALSRRMGSYDEMTEE